ncbi:NUDIX hydrolase [uncultured Bifidobacterium sp.]|uniref:NUDIX hydrolase n=1 Tax=uncultured Bifidobacterium sp. TaxID=165187 RepID=UPI0026286BAE|nr:NUDIX hydrolase [uncultured Bifidobacterium sp.]
MRRIIEAAGGIVYRTRPLADSDTGAPTTSPRNDGSKGQADTSAESFDDIEVCLVHRPRYDDWSWPKGKLEPNESHRHAAVREIEEESGQPVRLGPRLGEIEYPVDSEGHKGRKSRDSLSDTKHVVYWMAQIIDDDSARRRRPAFGPVTPADAAEIDERRWLPIRKARKLLSHSQDRDILDAFVDRLEEAAGAATLILVRHAKAEPRKQWRGVDEDRPITPKGAAAAYALVRELACFAPSRLVSSSWLRCMQTLAPYSFHVEMPIGRADELTEESFAQNPESSWNRLLNEMEACMSTTSTTAICMHRPVIGSVFGHLRPLCSSRTQASALVESSPFMPTGTALVMSLAAGPDGPSIIDVQKVVPLVH